MGYSCVNSPNAAGCALVHIGCQATINKQCVKAVY